jgi:hypothetical protein
MGITGFSKSVTGFNNALYFSMIPLGCLRFEKFMHEILAQG